MDIQTDHLDNSKLAAHHPETNMAFVYLQTFGRDLRTIETLRHTQSYIEAKMAPTQSYDYRRPCSPMYIHRHFDAEESARAI